MFSNLAITLSIYLGFVAYVNNENFGLWMAAIIILAIINFIFIIWCLG